MEFLNSKSGSRFRTSRVEVKRTTMASTRRNDFGLTLAANTQRDRLPLNRIEPVISQVQRQQQRSPMGLVQTSLQTPMNGSLMMLREARERGMEGVQPEIYRSKHEVAEKGLTLTRVKSFDGLRLRR